MSFVHLHTHSEYSLLDGANRIPELVAHVKKLGMDSLAVTDHGNLHAAWTFYEQARAQGIRPILGFEAYLAFGSRREQQKPQWAPAAYSHLVLLAKNRTGYKNLIKLSSIGYTEGFYRRPRIDREVLEQHSDGIVCLAACLSGEVALYLRQQKYDEAKKSAEWLARTFGRDGFWLEIQQHGIGEERLVTEGMLRLGEELGLGVVATNDAHYLRREDAEAHDVLLAIGTGADLDDPKRFRFTGQESYVKSEKEMRALFPDHPETLENTQTVANSCEFSFEKKYFLPGFPRPAEYASDEMLLQHLATDGAKGRYGDPPPANVQERMDYELGVINKAGYAGYFLIVQDFIRAARPRHSGGAGPRLRRRLAGGIRAGDHQRRPAQVRPALRALPESRARVDARHRRGLLLRAPGRGHRVRAGALRPRERGSDRHLRHDEGPRGGQGRRPRPPRPTR
jgi:DNA polymerase-3 subunit alpha